MLKRLIVISALLATSTFANANNELSLQTVNGNSYSFYSDPFKLADYVKEPQKAIEKAIVNAGWKIKEKGEGLVKAELDYKGYLLNSTIYFNDKEISFDHVSAQRNDCSGSRCKVKERHVDRWRLSLRRHVATQLTKLAKKDAVSSLN
ncbi:hypothetical protein [Pseudoalteromonas luteoviolacea]|uniref:hypothetical protein n=1 Tax=Pseudoalteromonas luteoviolacea TaxID=43657 RepID=UPI0011509D8C|nr:hypothetical protein [Pseudoalteromonas luteoviolacea]TQF70312.1 hypothetical protein FLM44_04250 [Pseudoalteromonas luteoviolacea]